MHYLIFGNEMREVEDTVIASNLLRKGWQKGPIKPDDNHEWSTAKGVWVKKENPAVTPEMVEKFIEFMKSQEAPQ